MSNKKCSWLQELQQTYLERADSKLSELGKALDAVIKEPDNFENRCKLHRILHNLAGSGASFGFSEISRTAKNMLDAFHSVPGAASNEKEQYVKDLRENFSAIRKAFKKAKDQFKDNSG